ncbi:MAG: A24 family peptidase [Chloroflexota bacterium]
MTPLIALIAIAGGGWGYVADRLAARWPAHDDGSVRGHDWRTVAVVAAGSLAPSALVARYADDPGTAAYLGVLVVALILLFATDLDQRLLPDVITLPIVVYALIGYAGGFGPFVQTPGELLLAAVVAVAVPVGLYVVSIPFGAGAIGMGDLKLLFGIGLLAGAVRLVAMVIVGAIAAAVGIVILLVERRITLKSYVPYGPFLIIGAIWAITVSRGA